MFVTFDRGVRVCLGVVALGLPERLWECLGALTHHESEHEFTVVCVVNAASPDGAPSEASFPAGVEVEYAGGNLGWSGGLHRARALTDAELFVWVQDDMVPEPGWLDALVQAADAHPRVGGFGSVRVDDAGEVVVHNAGAALPADAVERWNDTDRTPAELPAAVATYDWVTSKGFLTRTAVFDEVGGPDPRLWPLNHVDKDYCTHLRCHGWEVALVPGARLRHAGSQSAPTSFRAFLAHWREPWFNRRWATAVTALTGHVAEVTDHPCAEWRAVTADPVAVVSGLEASRMVVPLSRFHVAEAAATDAARAAREAELVRHADNLARARDELAAHARNLEAALATTTARADGLERAVATARAGRARARGRARRLRLRLDAIERSVSWRATRRLRGLVRRLRG